MTNEKLDNGSKDVVQQEDKEESMFYIKVFALGTDQTYVVRDGLIPISAFTAEATHAERLDGSPVKLVKDRSSFEHYRVLALR